MTSPITEVEGCLSSGSAHYRAQTKVLQPTALPTGLCLGGWQESVDAVWFGLIVYDHSYSIVITAVVLQW